MVASNPLAELSELLETFAAERDWQQFHTPKNLAIALAVEVGELLEHFQWRDDVELFALMATDKRREVEEELADVLIYLVRLGDVLGVNLLEAATDKMGRNAVRYPAEEVRGSAEKRPAVTPGRDDT